MMQHLPSVRRASSASSTSSAASSASTTLSHVSRRSCEGMTEDERRALWKCMLALQQRYGCYNSTRIDLAVNSGDDGLLLMPNPFIIDTLNRSVVHLPVEGWQMLDRSLHGTEQSHADNRVLKLRFWRSN
ncbi:hypothetical protein XA68_17897 [Ophiocordyceps unilateralis]|uniref:Uncharacterized protein n=1 Tax=Ophiocordyceps unilateralis TaxID=268505 RepID=A0A2A9P2U7_OPHUN|nr:hypothetical protein XA68_17897 [Ophiocordyceps unilateralis]